MKNTNITSEIPQLNYIEKLELQEQKILPQITFCKENITHRQIECYRYFLYFLGQAYRKTKWGNNRKTNKLEFFRNILRAVGCEVSFPRMLEYFYKRLDLDGNLVSPNHLLLFEQEEKFLLRCLREESEMLAIKAQHTGTLISNLFKQKQGED